MRSLSPSVPEVAAASGSPASWYDHRLVQGKSCGKRRGGGAFPHPAYQANQGWTIETNNKRLNAFITLFWFS